VDDRPPRVFLLSPASCHGQRAQLLFREGARFDLARRVRSDGGAPLGEVFSFLSGLYFRGKLAYARHFAAPPPRLGPAGGVYVIAPGAGLRGPDGAVTLADLRAFAGVDVASHNPEYRGPLLADARSIARRLSGVCEVVLLGSVASTRYLEVLAEAFGPSLRFPAEFVGRGDMSRGGLLLRCVREDRELTYVAVGAVDRHGPRPPRLAPMPRGVAGRPPVAGA
jgi:hypothetical protein